MPEPGNWSKNTVHPVLQTQDQPTEVLATLVE